MARTACGKNGNTADPSFHGHSTLHPVAGNGLGGLLCSAGAPDLVAAECLSLRNISTGKRNNPPVFYGSPGARSADWPVNCPTWLVRRRQGMSRQDWRPQGIINLQHRITPGDHPTWMRKN